MDLTALQAKVREAILERSSDVGLVNASELTGWINSANRDVFNQAVKWNPRPWIERSAELAYGNPLAFSTIVAAPARVKSVHLLAAKDGTRFVKITPSEEGFLDDAEIDSAEPVSVPAYPCKWFAEGTSIWLSPLPAGAVVLKAWFVRELVDLSAGTDEPLRGLFADHHDLIAYKAAQLIYRKDEVVNTPWDRAVEDGLRELRRALSRNQGQRTRRVRPASHFPNTRRRR